MEAIGNYVDNSTQDEQQTGLNVGKRHSSCGHRVGGKPFIRCPHPVVTSDRCTAQIRVCSEL